MHVSVDTSKELMLPYYIRLFLGYDISIHGHPTQPLAGPSKEFFGSTNHFTIGNGYCSSLGTLKDVPRWL